jgi:RNA polymerase sigma-70 factor (ECF subfamily)
VDNSADKDLWFVQQLADAQRGLYAFILQLLSNRSDADDALQATNLVMWSKRSQFTRGGDFAAWAARIAYFEVLTLRKRKGRERLRFDDALVEQLAHEAAADAGQVNAVLGTLRQCMEKLASQDRDLLRMQYADDLRPREIAQRTGRSAGAIAVAMHRIRMALLKCIDEHKPSAGEELQ